jgi:hypothetical protein
VPVEFRVASSPLELTEMLLGGKIDTAILPPDTWGRQRVDFGTFYFVDRDAYMVPYASRLKTIDEVDNRRVRVIAIEGTTSDRAAARRLRNTTVNPVGSVEGALEMLRTGTEPTPLPSPTRPSRRSSSACPDRASWRAPSAALGWRSRCRRTISMLSTT